MFQKRLLVKNKVIGLKGYDGDDFTITNEINNETIDQVRNIFFANNIKVDHKLEHLMASIVDVLHRQSHSDRHNPYVEHGKTHSIRVATGIIEQFNFFNTYLPQQINILSDELKMKSEEDIKFVLIIVALLHDCNYFVDHKKNENKAIHSLKSALTAYDAIQEQLELILIDKGLNKKDCNKLLTIIYDAILCHNGDKKHHKFNNVLQSPIGNIPFNSQHELNMLIESCMAQNMAHAFLGLCCAKCEPIMGRYCLETGEFGIRYQEASKQHRLLLYLLRLADDFDSTQDRLLMVQKSALDKLLPFAKEYMERLFDDPSEYHIGSWPWDDILNKHQSSKQDIYTSKELSALKKIIFNNPGYAFGTIKENTINNQFRYYVGLWLVGKIQLKVTNGTIELEVTIKTEPKLQKTISFFKKQKSLSDGKNQIPVYCSDFYAERICPKDMNVVIK